MIKLNESNDDQTITLQINDPDSQIKNLITYIKDLSDSGHSFNVVVDPGDKDYENTFWIDGDGACHINSIKENQELPLQSNIVDDDKSSVVTPTGIKSDIQLEKLVSRLRS